MTINDPGDGDRLCRPLCDTSVAMSKAGDALYYLDAAGRMLFKVAVQFGEDDTEPTQGVPEKLAYLLELTSRGGRLTETPYVERNTDAKID